MLYSELLTGSITGIFRENCENLRLVIQAQELVGQIEKAKHGKGHVYLKHGLIYSLLCRYPLIALGADLLFAGYLAVFVHGKAVLDLLRREIDIALNRCAHKLEVRRVYIEIAFESSILNTGIGAVDGQLRNGKGVPGCDVAVIVLLVQGNLPLDNIVTIVILPAVGELSVKNKFLVNGKVVQQADDPNPVIADGFSKPAASLTMDGVA